MENSILLTPHVKELLYQALETEKGGVQIYTTALRCASNTELREEWQKYLEQTKNHVQVVTNILENLELDPEAETPGRKVVRNIGTCLVKSMEMALRGGDPRSAQIVPLSVSHSLKRRTILIGVLSVNWPSKLTPPVLTF